MIFFGVDCCAEDLPGSKTRHPSEDGREMSAGYDDRKNVCNWRMGVSSGSLSRLGRGLGRGRGGFIGLAAGDEVTQRLRDGEYGFVRDPDRAMNCRLGRAGMCPWRARQDRWAAIFGGSRSGSVSRLASGKCATWFSNSGPSGCRGLTLPHWRSAESVQCSMDHLLFAYAFCPP